mmetsp:Transcript_34966/g.56650  ORF Transcript_34966/g.56650 Transcript_34966/m.56650 type:complete len:579 (+) Transcript_34966:2-1738(+)
MADSDNVDVVKSIAKAEKEIQKHGILKVNGIVEILEHLSQSESPIPVRIKGAVAMARIFLRLYSEGHMKTGPVRSRDVQISMIRGKKRKNTSSESKMHQKVKEWLDERYLECAEVLGAIYCSSGIDERLQTAAFHSALEMCKIDGERRGKLYEGTFQKLLIRLLCVASLPKALLDHFDSKFLRYIDVSKDTFKVLKAALSSSEALEKSISCSVTSSEHEDGHNENDKKSLSSNKTEILKNNFLGNATGLLLRMSDAKNQFRYQGGEKYLDDSKISSLDHSKKRRRISGIEQENGILEDMRDYAKALSQAWLALFKHRLPTSSYEQTLKCMKDTILPRIEQPILMFDFLKDSYDIGGFVSLLALEGLFILMQKHNLDYPDFFPKLYQLLTIKNLQSSACDRFFSLLPLFLKSFKLPAYMVAAFAKRLCRISLKAEVPICIFSLALVFNLLKRHPQCQELVHRVPKEEGILAVVRRKPFGPDPYQESNPDMATCKAIDSCLWEIKTLKNHYSPKVVALVRNFTDENAPKYEIDMEPYIKENFNSLYEEEANHRINHRVALRYNPPEKLFAGNSFMQDFQE